MKQYNCIVCKKRVKPKDRRNVTEEIKVYLNAYLHLDVQERSTICNKCRHKYKLWKTKRNIYVEDEDTSDPEFLPPPSPPPTTTTPRPLLSPPSIILPFPGVSNTHSRCIVCKARNSKLTVISTAARVHAFIDRNMFISSGARCCPHHLDSSSLNNESLDNISTTNTCRVNKTNLTKFLKSLRESCDTQPSHLSFDNMDDRTIITFTGLDNTQFNDLCRHLENEVKNTATRTAKTTIGIFLFKLKAGMSNRLIASIFDINKSSVRRAIGLARRALLKCFVPFYLGIESITRQDIIEKHTTPIAKTLLDCQDKLILVLDGTYIYINKSKNFLFQRRSFSLHKSRCLVKPMVIVTTTGHFVTILGPYLAKNNDASILNHILKQNIDDIKGFVEENDILVVDRGFRDSLTLLEDLGIKASMPKFMKKGEKQMAESDSNTSRMVTKIRWVVEAANARIKRFKYLDKVLPTNQVPNIGDYVRIVCALSNRYFKPLHRPNDEDVQIAELMKIRSRQVNLLKCEIEEKGLDRGVKQWKKADESSLSFPTLSEEQLRDLTLGTYQLKLSPSYIKEFVDSDSDIFVHQENEGLVRVRIQSRHVSAKKYLMWIKFNQNDVIAWYCKCRAGARVVGTCAHIAAAVWYLGCSSKPDSFGVKDWGKYIDDADQIPENIDSSDSSTNCSQNTEE